MSKLPVPMAEVVATAGLPQLMFKRPAVRFVPPE